MRTAAIALCLLLTSAPAWPQAPAVPPVSLNVPDLGYVAVPEPVRLPAGVVMGATSSVAFDSRGHLFVLNRGAQPLVEFDRTGTFVRALGELSLTRAHGLRIDAQDNIWVTDVGAHVVLKLSSQGRVLLTLGTKGQAGDWNEAGRSHLLNEPNDLALAPNGDIYVIQGHGRADPRVLKFRKDGTFVTSWGGMGTGPGQFGVAHSIAIDGKGLVWVADRENRRIQVFDPEGRFIRESRYPARACGLYIKGGDIYMTTGFDGQIARLDETGHVLAATGKIGKGLGAFGEAHYLAIGPTSEIYVADTINGPLQKFVKR